MHGRWYMVRSVRRCTHTHGHNVWIIVPSAPAHWRATPYTCKVIKVTAIHRKHAQAFLNYTTSSNDCVVMLTNIQYWWCIRDLFCLETFNSTRWIPFCFQDYLNNALQLLCISQCLSSHPRLYNAAGQQHAWFTHEIEARIGLQECTAYCKCTRAHTPIT